MMPKIADWTTKIMGRKKSEKIASLLILVLAGVWVSLYCAEAFFDADLFDKKSDISNKHQLTIDFVTDIHAGSSPISHEDVAHSATKVVYPDKYRQNLEPLLKDNADLIITLGDNIDHQVDSQSCQYDQDLLEMFEGKNVLWDKGNHDKNCFQYLNKDNYYYQDFDNIHYRIIMLDADIDIDKNELEWLKGALKTDNNVLVVAHIPIFDPDSGKLLSRYNDLEQALSSSPNVKYFFSGHLHDHYWDKVYNGIHYYILPSVSGVNHEGYFFKMTLGN